MSEQAYPCEFCDTNQPQVLKQVTVTRQRHGQWFVFEGVWASVCPNCGHRYFSADMLEAMEKRMNSATIPADARPISGWVMALPQTM
jgi:YgiT-type zinc finger domain-containing protein